MKRWRDTLVGSAVVVAVLAGCAEKQPGGEAAAASDRIVVENVGFATPESVYFHEAADVYLVSNINGSPLETDGNGFISKVGPDGKVIDLKWIDGAKEGVSLDAPKGMAVAGGLLYVADLTNIRMFDATTGAQKNSVAVPNSTFLNDVAAREDGSVLVTDSGLKAGADGFEPSGTDALYLVKPDGSIEKLASGDELGRPNGVLPVPNGTMIVTFGTGEIYRIDETGKRQDVSAAPKGALDGLVALEGGRLLMSSWGGSALYVLEPDGSFSTLAEELDAPADIGLDTKRKRVLVPLFKLDKVVILPLH